MVGERIASDMPTWVLALVAGVIVTLILVFLYAVLVVSSDASKEDWRY